MYPLGSPAFELRRRTASDAIPGWVVGLLAGLQVILWLAIIVFEGVSVRYDAVYGTIYAGFWCSGIFFTTWVSMFSFCKFFLFIDCQYLLKLFNLFFSMLWQGKLLRCLSDCDEYDQFVSLHYSCGIHIHFYQ